jgi:mRNA interferase RelE/StbE
VASYSAFLTQSAAKELEDIGSDADRRRILDRIRRLAEDPRPQGCVTLAGRQDRVRLRQGDYRIVYSIDDAGRIVTVFRIAHRRDVYRPDR